MLKRGLIVAVVSTLILVAGLYLGAGFIVFNQLTAVEPGCSGNHQTNTPDNFNTDDVDDLEVQFDASPYFIQDYEAVNFPSRDADLTINAWYVPAEEGNAPAVIIVHGVGDCKRTPFVLTAGGMLHDNGFHVLMIDLRDHGESEIEDGRFAAGTEEYQDVLGAWDWLVTEQNISPERIGLMGFSLGAATVMIATGEEPQVAAVWEDSGYAELEAAIRAELKRNGYPEFFMTSGLLVADMVGGIDLTNRSPLEGAQKLDGRPLFITHSTGDTRLSVDYAYELAEAVEADGGQVEPWIVPDIEHHRTIFVYPDEYETRLVDFFSAALGGG